MDREADPPSQLRQHADIHGRDSEHIGLTDPADEDDAIAARCDADRDHVGDRCRGKREAPGVHAEKRMSGKAIAASESELYVGRRERQIGFVRDDERLQPAGGNGRARVQRARELVGLRVGCLEREVARHRSHRGNAATVQIRRLEIDDGGKHGRYVADLDRAATGQDGGGDVVEPMIRNEAADEVVPGRGADREPEIAVRAERDELGRGVGDGNREETECADVRIDFERSLPDRVRLGDRPDDPVPIDRPRSTAN